MNSRISKSLIVVTLSWLLLGSAAAGVDVYLNGVNISGAKDQVIENAKVLLDKNGDVHINAPDYKVRELSKPGPASAPPASTPPTSSPASSPAPTAPTTQAQLKAKYFVITDVTQPKVVGYEIQIIVNNKFLKTMNDDFSQAVIELNNYLKEGANTVSFRALRPQGKSSQSTLASDAFTIILGEGNGDEGGTLTIENVLGEFKVTAIDRGEKSQTFSFQAK